MCNIKYSAVQRQKGITDNFVKIELSPLPGPEWQIQYKPYNTLF